MYSIENSQLKVSINSTGAELKSVFHKGHSLQYMWEADPAFWAKSSPVLFPVVGELRDKSYRYKNKLYHLPRHGFAREMEFIVTEHGPEFITFTLESSEESLDSYPFRFLFSIVYTLSGDELSVGYLVENRGEEEMFFSVGGHPAFKVPMVNGTTYNDYKLLFSEAETAGQWPVSAEGLIETAPRPLLQDTNELPLTKELFSKDAVVFKNLRSDSVQLQSDKTTHGLEFSFAGFPFLGLWAAPGADFLCIEPWCGIADNVEADGLLEQKEGINRLPPGETFSRAWKVHFY